MEGDVCETRKLGEAKVKKGENEKDFVVIKENFGFERDGLFFESLYFNEVCNAFPRLYL